MISGNLYLEPIWNVWMCNHEYRWRSWEGYEEVQWLCKFSGLYFCSVGLIQHLEWMWLTNSSFVWQELAGNFLTVSKDDIRNTLPDLPKRPHAFDSPFSVYVTKLSRSIENNEHLEQLFSKHGKVECAELICDKVSSRSRGYGFVTMWYEKCHCCSSRSGKYW